MKAPAYLLMVGALAGAIGAHGETFVSVQDGKQMLIDGVVTTVSGTDSLALVVLKDGKLSLRYQIAVPASVIGPPTSVAVTRDGKLALVTAGFKRATADPLKSTPDDRVTVVDLAAQPPRVLDTVHVGAAPAGVSINATTTLALVANHDDGTVSVLRIDGSKVSVLDHILIGDAKSGPMHVAFTPDGRRALVSRDGDHRITMLAIDGDKVSVTKRDIFPGQRPDCIDVRSQGDLAVVANIGRGQGDADTVSLIDLTVEPARVVDTVSVGQTPESVFFSPDGSHVAVNVINGSNKPAGSPFHNASGKLDWLRVDGKTLVQVASTPIGAWSQGMAFSSDGRWIVVQNAAEKQLQMIRIDGDQVLDGGSHLQLDAVPSAIRSVPR